jgi:Transposase DDE domain
MALAEGLQTVSHDGLTRLLQADWSGPTLLELAWRTLFACERGALLVDDTVLPKPFATAIEGLAWLYSRQERKPIYGLSLVLLVWTNGTLRVPVGMRLWRRGGASKHALALEWLSSARNRLRCRPEDVLFDAWYPSKALLQRIRDSGWYFGCRLKKNHRFNGHAVRPQRRPPCRAEVDWLSGGLPGLVVRHGKKSSATKRLTLPPAEVRRLYRLRAQSEEGIRVCTNPLGLSGCQARSTPAQAPHVTCGLVTCWVLERERHDRGLTIYKLKRQLSGHGRMLALPGLEQLRQTA